MEAKLATNYKIKHIKCGWIQCKILGKIYVRTKKKVNKLEKDIYFSTFLIFQEWKIAVSNRQHKKNRGLNAEETKLKKDLFSPKMGVFLHFIYFRQNDVIEKIQ